MGETSKKVSTGSSVANSKRVKATSTAPKKTAASAPKKVSKKQVADTGDAVVKAAKQNEALIEEVVSKATKGKVSKKQVEAVIEEAPGFWAKLKAFLGL